MKIHDDINVLLEEYKKYGNIEDLSLDQLIYAICRITIATQRSQTGTGKFMDLVDTVKKNLKYRLDLLSDYYSLKN